MKVFGIGLPRCGGQTLQRVLHELLGLCVHSPGNRWDLLDEYDAAVEVFIDPETLLERYGSDVKFVMNTRATGPWMDSCRRVYNQSLQWNHPIWRHPVEDFLRYRSGYLARRQSTLHRVTFDTLTLDLTDKPSWQPICDFLNAPVPGIPFPNIDRIGRSHA